MKVTIYMKSGNKIKLRFVKSLDYKYSGNRIDEMTLVQSRFAKFIGLTFLDVQSIDLSQIEAITQN